MINALLVFCRVQKRTHIWKFEGADKEGVHPLPQRVDAGVWKCFYVFSWKAGENNSSNENILSSLIVHMASTFLSDKA